MGYTHYWYRTKEIEQTTYDKIVEDFKKFLPLFRAMDIQLADGSGEGQPELTEQNVSFNGNAHCGHKSRDLGIAWPSKKTKNGTAPSVDKAIDGSWFAGCTLNQRTCGGDCSHETLSFPRVYEPPTWRQDSDREDGLHFEFCKTAYKPYDFAVNMFLIIAQHYLKNDLIVSSDGETKDWLDAACVCQNALGYGEDFHFRE